MPKPPEPETPEFHPLPGTPGGEVVEPDAWLDDE